MDDLEDIFVAHYPGDFHNAVEIRDFGIRVCRWYLDLGVADEGFSAGLRGDAASFSQRMSEVLLANELARAEIPITPPTSLPEVRKLGGPDFLIEHEGRRIWIEVVCPEPMDLPAEWLAPIPVVSSIRRTKH